ncbi:MAG: S1 family peptidase [Ardenticatenaceae bacterium]
MPNQHTHVPEAQIIRNSLPAVVQVVALQRSFLGNTSVAWTGSGTIVSPEGIILTNCHVANPRAMGMPSPAADKLGISITQRSDEAPALTYLAEIVAQSPELDLAVLKITHTLNGRRVSGLNLPSISIGDSDDLELADTLAIFGYPGIGGETVTFTSGSVAGFTKQKGVSPRRAWIKTDATIAGGNSGGTAINQAGLLVGIPTQAAAGTGITPVDARPVVDTNRDGRVDERDTPMAIGGFINGLRPVNLAKPLLQKAGVNISAPRAQRSTPPSHPHQPSPSRATRPAQAQHGGQISFTELLFSSKVTKDGRPINPSDLLPTGTKKIYATFNFTHMANNIPWGQVWSHNGKVIYSTENKWKEGTSGRTILALSSKSGLKPGEYRLALTVRKQIAAEGLVVIGKRDEDKDSEISGQIVDERTRRGIQAALVIALKPNVTVREFTRTQDKNMAFTTARTDRQGKFTFPQQLPKGHAYGLLVIARGYRDLAVDSALRVTSTAPEHAQMNPISLRRE